MPHHTERKKEKETSTTNTRNNPSAEEPRFHTEHSDTMWFTFDQDKHRCNFLE